MSHGAFNVFAWFGQKSIHLVVYTSKITAAGSGVFHSAYKSITISTMVLMWCNVFPVPVLEQVLPVVHPAQTILIRHFQAFFE